MVEDDLTTLNSVAVHCLQADGISCWLAIAEGEVYGIVCGDYLNFIRIFFLSVHGCGLLGKRLMASHVSNIVESFGVVFSPTSSSSDMSLGTAIGLLKT